MFSFVEFIQKQINSIISTETVIFCGAGLSYNSGLPVANEIVQYILDKLPLSNKDKESIIKSNYPFEGFIETIQKHSNIEHILEIYEFGMPNTNHILLAKMAKSGFLKIICTTNFDKLIEKAFELQGLKEGVDYISVYKTGDLKNIKWTENLIYIIKLHGSIDDKKDMAITIQQVASKVVNNQRKKVIKYIFSNGLHKKVIVLGYSCSDHFDITPEIESINQKQKEIILIQHRTIKNRSELKYESISSQDFNNPFKKYKNGTRIFCNTDEFVKLIWENDLKQKYQFIKNTENKDFWKNKIDNWSSELDSKNKGINKYVIAGRILNNISKFKSALKYYNYALKYSKALGDKREIRNRICNIASTYRTFGKFDKSLDFFINALKLSKEIKDKKGEANCHGDIGSIYRLQGDYKKALFYQKKSLKLAKKSGDLKGQGNSHSNIGNTYHMLGQYKKAIKHHNVAYKIASKHGDKKVEGIILCNIGSAYNKVRDYNKALLYHQKALLIAKKIGDRRMQGANLTNIGAEYNESGNYEKAIKFHKQALKIALKVGDKESKPIILRNRGTAYAKVGKYKNAIKDYKKALEILVKQVGNNHTLIKSIQKNLEMAKRKYH